VPWKIFDSPWQSPQKGVLQLEKSQSVLKINFHNSALELNLDHLFGSANEEIKMSTPRAGRHVACALLLLLLPEAGAFAGSFLPAQHSRGMAARAGFRPVVSMALSAEGFAGSVLVVGATGLVGGEVTRSLPRSEHKDDRFSLL